MVFLRIKGKSELREREKGRGEREREKENKGIEEERRRWGGKEGR